MDIAAFVVVAMCPFAIAADRPVVDHRLPFIDRLLRVQSVIATFRQETVYSPPPDLKGDGQLSVYKGLYVEQGQFSFLDGRARYDVEYAPETVQRLETDNVPFVRKTVKAYALDRADSLWVHSQTGQAAGRISDSEKLPFSYPIDVALGLRGDMEQAWLDRSRLEGAICAAMDNGRGEIRMADKAHPEVTHRWEVDPAAHYAIVGYQRIGRQGFAVTDLKCSDFETYGELTLPRVIEERYMASVNGVVQATRTVRVTVTDYALKSPENTAERYHIAFPAKSLIQDNRRELPVRATTTRPSADR